MLSSVPAGECGSAAAASGEPCEPSLPPSAGTADDAQELPPGHSRNSSSQSAGYGSLQSQGEPSQPGHSRQGSGSESAHLRLV